jgi:hypothetical protein
MSIGLFQSLKIRDKFSPNKSTVRELECGSSAWAALESWVLRPENSIIMTKALED